MEFIIQIFLYQAVFLITYDIFHKKDTFFTLNRVYLLVTSILSITLPFLSYESLQKSISNDYVIQLPTIILGTGSVTKPSQAIHQTEYLNFLESFNSLEIIYISGVLISSLILCYKLLKIHRLQKTAVKDKNLSYLYHLPTNKIAFTFLNKIFIGTDIPLNQKTQIIHHEKVHLKQLHSIDILWFEFLKIVLWFNPLIYIYKRKILSLHEYISDAEVIKIFNKKKYFEQLLNSTFQSSHIQFVNNFFDSGLLKNRIYMLQRKKSTLKSLIKYISILPLLMVLIFLTAFSHKVFAFAKKSSSQINESIEEFNFSDQSEVNGFKPFIEKSTQEKPLKPQKIKNEIISDNLKSENTDPKEKLKNIKSKIETGELSFEEAVQLYSEDPGSKGNGGLYIVNENSPFEDSFKSEVFSLSPGQVSGIFRTSFGYHIVKLDKIEDQNFYARHILLAADLEIPFAKLEIPPILSDCKELSSQKSFKNCFVQKVMELVDIEFNTQIADSLGLLGINRIYARFDINTNGIVENIQARAPHPLLEKEAIRVINTLPKMQPGMVNSRPVITKYSLPILINVANETSSNQDFKRQDIVLTENLTNTSGKSIEVGYYLITNIFKSEKYLKKGLEKLSKTSLNAKYFQNPKDNYYYVYIDYTRNLEEAKKLLYSDINKNYQGDIYILKIE